MNALVRVSLPVLALAALLAGAPRAIAEKDFDALRREFPGVVGADGDSAARVAAVKEVAALGTADAAKLLVVGLAALDTRCDAERTAFEKLLRNFEEVNVPLDVMKDDFKTRTEMQNRIMAAEARQRQDRVVYDAFRDALAGLRDGAALAAANTAARKEKSWMLREVVAEGTAANAGSSTALELSLRWSREKDSRLRAASLRGWKGRKEPEIVAEAEKALADGDWPVRLAAAQALAAVAEPRVLRPLIEALGREDGRLRDDLRDLLRGLTGMNFDADPQTWQQWYNDNRDVLEGEGPKSALFGAFKAKGGEPEKKSVYGIESRSRRIVFIIDTSGSMKDPLATDAGKGTATGLTAEEEEERRSSKIEIAKRELKRAIRGLEADARFNIISYGTHVIRWKKEMVKADMPTKNEAYAFVRDMQAAGGTYTYGALQEAFHIGGLGVTDKNYDPTVDTIYLISDGAPTDNDMDRPQYIDPQIILDGVREWNRIGRVVIHAVAVDSKAAGGRFVDFMKKLAAENGGQYTQRE